MKRSIYKIFIAAALVSAFAACQKNDETTPTTGGTTLDRDKFIGTWHVTSHHSPSGQTLHWDMTIVAGSSTNEIYLDNFDEMGASNHVTATVSGSSFTVPNQTGPPNSTIYQGSGSYSSGTLSFTYTADDQANPVDSVSATASR